MEKCTTNKHEKRISGIGFICWIAIPSVMATLLVLDGLGLYTFNTERLLVIGASVIIVLIPFFEEISVKNISLKKS